MMRILTSQEMALSFLKQLGAKALVDGDVANHFENFGASPEVYEMAFLEVIKMLELPVAKDECSLVDCNCPGHWRADAKKRRLAKHAPKLEKRDKQIGKISKEEIHGILEELERTADKADKISFMKADKKER